MSKISDELRAAANLTLKYGSDDYNRIHNLADRIDAEMVKLPKDRDGVPIHVGDTVYLDDGRKAEVRRIQISERENSICFDVCGDFFSLWPEDFTHTRHDSLERIADDMDNFADANYASGLLKQGIKDFADRIRKLAKEQAND